MRSNLTRYHQSVPTVQIQIVLLPGMDGTGNLFTSFIESLPPGIDATVVRYPSDRVQTYEQLLHLLESSLPTSAPFVLVAESFSTPLAIQWAAKAHGNLKGLVICAGFASSPVHPWLKSLCMILSPICFLVPPPATIIRRFLVGGDATNSLVATVRSTIRSVKPKVLAHRLRMTLTCDSRLQLSEVKVPTLFIQPTQDRLVRSSCLTEMRTIRPEAAVAFIPSPHLLLQAIPKESAEVIASYVRKLAAI